MIHYLTPNNLSDYRAFLRIKQLPSYRIRGRVAWFPDEYADKVFGEAKPQAQAVEYVPHAACFDYQRDISRLAIARQKFAVFADCGLGKTLILLEFAKHATASHGKRTLIVSPLMVIDQTCSLHSPASVARAMCRCNSVGVSTDANSRTNTTDAPRRT